jgi:hypothetical protein|tara:strand:+ start:592 stop:918 length:327 start_codon:yes stop_codon:yes gene_type:complete
MANDFKGVQSVGVTSVTTVYTAPASKDSIILELDIANTTASAVTASAEVLDSSASTDAFIVKDAPIPAGSSLQVISGQKVILETGDSIRVTASGACDVVCSILEDVNS